MERKIIFLVNPISGVSKKEGIADLIENVTSEKGIPYKILPTNILGNYDYVIEQIQLNGYTDVVIVGGDGTVNQVVYALKELPIQFGIIPMGSGNGLAFAVGISRKPIDALQAIFTNNSKKIDAFYINDAFSCMLSGIGFDAQVAHDFAAKSTRGLLTYTQQSLLNLFKAHPFQFKVTIDNFSFFTDAFFISIANSNQFGNYVTIAPKADLSDGLLDIVIVQKMNKAKLPFEVLKQIRGNNKVASLVEDMTHQNVLYFQTEALTIENKMLAPLHIDGEPKETASHFKVQIIPQCFDLIVASKK